MVDMSTNPSLPLQGKTAIVTGASRGIGAGIALRLAQEGAKVVLGFTSPSSASKAASLQRTIEALPHGPKAHPVQADLASLTGPQDLVKATLAWLLPATTIDILVNNAGVECVAPLASLTAADYDTVYSTNVRGVILLTQAVLPHLPPRARVINITSVGARAGFAGLSLYTSSKAAVEGLTRSWAAELGGNGTTVNAVAPGPVESDMLDKIPEEIKELQQKTTPLEGRFGTVEEVAEVVSWLAGRGSAWVTGQCINASGGWQMI
ncbi:hypothetical protein N0V93_004481 [Gnomoniopsis smithogilvyi]|uniref:3-oxoacyl-[acyl-carrier-protein] reductase n=1 Tax=Gnomoniopsis smithogilvyi TaxID=1191159 RepID=A0A9W8YUS9_9PEZI|nr:hypothetical protein N0V93_004481 [Gnomoniopsis smithogilvyi]